LQLPSNFIPHRVPVPHWRRAVMDLSASRNTSIK